MEDKEVNLNIRIQQSLRKEFYDVAESRAQTPSILLRNFIKDYIKEKTKEEIK